MKQILLLFGTLCLSISLHAQSNYEVRLGAGVPMDDFKDTTRTGIDAGFKYRYTFIKGLSVFASVDLMWNYQSKDIKDKYKQMRASFAEAYNLDDEEDIISYDDPTYFNIPTFIGIHYCYDFSKKLGVWAEAGAGCNLYMQTELFYLGESPVSEQPDRSKWHHYKYTETYKVSPAFAYTAGLGLKFKKYTLGLRYIGLGSHKVKYDQHEKYKQYYNSNKNAFDREKTLKKDKVDLSALSITVGYCF